MKKNHSHFVCITCSAVTAEEENKDNCYFIELENGEVSLDESIEKYTKAMKLVKECDSELKNIEEKVNKIVTEDGSLEDFEPEN